MSLTITPLSPALGAQISGVDISRDITVEERDAIVNGRPDDRDAVLAAGCGAIPEADAHASETES